jgi:RimJ/RimL family protein N-acetyltransferase
MFARLSDDRLVFVRPINPADKEMLQESLAHLSESSRQRRFLGPKKRFSTKELRYLTEVDGHDHFALVVLPADERHDIVAVARFVRLADDPKAAEAAIVVDDEYQHAGLGTLLARRLADAAREHGVERLTASIASDNRPALKLMRQIDDRLQVQSLGSSVTDVVARLAIPDLAEDPDVVAADEQTTAAA